MYASLRLRVCDCVFVVVYVICDCVFVIVAVVVFVAARS